MWRLMASRQDTKLAARFGNRTRQGFVSRRDITSARKIHLGVVLDRSDGDFDRLPDLGLELRLRHRGGAARQVELAAADVWGR